jgi:hypothetical protein
MTPGGGGSVYMVDESGALGEDAALVDVALVGDLAGVQFANMRASARHSTRPCFADSQL